MIKNSLKYFFKYIKNHSFRIMYCKLKCSGTSLVVRWLRIHLPMQGSQIPSLVRDQDLTCMKQLNP